MLSERLFPSVVGQDGVSGCGFAVGHFLKFDILGFFQIDSSAGVNEGVLYRERNLPNLEQNRTVGHKVWGLPRR
jgi:hypothetical protein